MKTLVLGGYGNFGTRICRALRGDSSIQLLIGGRDLRRAEALAGELGHGSRAVVIDHSAADFAQTLRDLGVDLLIHTAGPFQQQAYGVALAAADAGAHYIDLADGRRFVCDFAAAVNGVFSSAGRTAISGASTVPALSSAVVDYLCQGWQTIHSINSCIAPAQQAPRGVATLAGVLSYCGQALEVWADGQWQQRLGWAKPEVVTFARLHPRLGALCDIPDLELFPARYRVTRQVIFSAALELGFTQHGFATLARLSAMGIIQNPMRLAKLLNSAANAMNFMGSALGGMVVRVEGLDAAGKPAHRAWHIAADNNHGPEIPCMAAILLARKLASGQIMPTGASACVGLLKLAEFEPEFARWGMDVDVINEAAANPLPD